MSGASNLFSQNCPDAPDLQALEMLCDYEDPVDLGAAAGALEGTWSVTPPNGNVFVYLDWLYYQGANPGDYILRLDVDNAAASCASFYEFDIQLITTALVWPIPELICPGDSYYVGDTPLMEEGFHEVYLPRDDCDSLVQVILVHDDSVCLEDSDDESDEVTDNPDGTQQSNTGTNSGSASDDALSQDDIPDIITDNTVTTDDDTLIDVLPDDNAPVDVPANTGGLALSDIDDNELIYATAFSPDSNGVNDLFGLINHDLDLESYSFRIYDRWGSEVFQTENPYERWDGSIKGTTAPNGVYAFIARGKMTSGEELWQKGPITLIR